MLTRSLIASGVLALAAPVASAQLDADFTASPTSGFSLLEVAFTDTTTGGAVVSYSWNFGDGATSVEANPTHTYVQPGSYTVTLSVFGTAFPGFDTEVKVDYITVDPVPLIVDFDATPVSGTNPLQVAFTDLSTGAEIDSWLWDFGDGNTSSESDPTHTYLSPGTYTVSLDVTVGVESGSLVETDLITVDPAPLVVDFTASTSGGVNPVEVTFTDTSSGATVTDWLWDFGDGNGSDETNPTHTYDAPGSFDVSLTAFVGQQSATLVQRSLITVDPAPLALALHAVPNSGESALPVQFTAQAMGVTPDSWFWDFGDGNSSTEQDPFHIYETGPDDASYTVTLTATFGGQVEVLVERDAVSVKSAFVEHAIQQLPIVEVVSVADLDGDGDDDVLHSFGFFAVGGVVGWNENLDGLGTFGEGSNIALSASTAVAVLATDLDGDDDLDVVASVTTVFDPGWFRWFENVSGQGDFGPGQGVAPGLGGTVNEVEAADLDGDGDVDLVVRPSLDVGWVENRDGLGDFDPYAAIDASGQARGMAVGDLDGDADPDVLVIAPLAWIENTGGGSFGPRQGIDAAVGGRYPLVADLDGDGDLDIVHGFLEEPSVVWLSNLDGRGDFGPPQLVGDGLPDPVRSISSGDLDGDGDVDVLVAGGAVAFWIPNQGGGVFGAPKWMTGDLPSSKRITVGDFDGDGDADPLAAGSLDVLWYENPLASPTWPFLGGGAPGALGYPVLSGDGEPLPGETVTLSLTNALPSSSTTLVLGLSALNAAFKGGVLVPSPDLLLFGLPLSGRGKFSFDFSWPDDLPGDVTLWWQHWVIDPSGPAGYAGSNAISITTPP